MYQYCYQLDISIHALVKRATFKDNISPRRKPISIHALVKRATLCAKCKYIDVTYFNPRPREEGDMDEIAFETVGL